MNRVGRICLAGLYHTIAGVLVLCLCASALFAFDEDAFVEGYLWDQYVALPASRRPKIALVLGGGGARGLAHIGVLKVLNEERIPIDILTGTSVGALVGALYCAGVPITQIETMGTSVGWNDLVDVSVPSFIKLFLNSDLLSNERIESYLEKTIGNKRFDELKVPFACVAVDIMTGERIIMRDGNVALAARASATIPGIFNPVEYRHRYLVDGGIFDNIPVDVAHIMGADYVVAVAVSGDFAQNTLSNVLMVMGQALTIQGRILEEQNLEKADFVVRPHVGEISSMDLGRTRECMDAGVEAARRDVRAIKQMLLKKFLAANISSGKSAEHE